MKFFILLLLIFVSCLFAQNITLKEVNTQHIVVVNASEHNISLMTDLSQKVLNPNTAIFIECSKDDTRFISLVSNDGDINYNSYVDCYTKVIVKE